MKPHLGWKWLKWTFGLWSDPGNRTYLGIDFGALEVVWRMKGYRAVMSREEILELVSQVAFRNWTFETKEMGDCAIPLRHGALFVRVVFWANDYVSGHEQPQYGRWWRLSQHATKVEIVHTCLKAVLTALEHEAREHFTYRGRAVFNSHIALDALYEACEKTLHRQK